MLAPILKFTNSNNFSLVKKKKKKEIVKPANERYIHATRVAVSIQF